MCRTKEHQDSQQIVFPFPKKNRHTCFFQHLIRFLVVKAHISPLTTANCVEFISLRGLWRVKYKLISVRDRYNFQVKT